MENATFTFKSKYKVIKQDGNLVYEYNPFRNYRVTGYSFEYKNHLYIFNDLKTLGISIYLEGNEITEITNSILLKKDLWEYKLNNEDITQLVTFKMPGELTDFDTSLLSFSLNNPVEVLPQYSYDGSVNLILNDGKNSPRLINSRFTPLGRNKYTIIDRKGDNDTNIYDLGELFDVDTSLYKESTTIPSLEYFGTFSSGNLSVGNYHFYFKYMDADGNETDFIAESGLVSIFIGEEPYNISSGFREQNSYKGVSFYLSDLDIGYQYISVYYTRATSDILLNAVTSAYKLNQKFIINSANACKIKVTGFEEKEEIPLTDINPFYLIASSVETLATCLNRLFFGNVIKANIPYQELTDISLRCVPYYTQEEYNITDKVSADYTIGNDFLNSYYNSQFIYNKVGYWPDEIYRLGIVYILSDNSLSPVFNIRGCAKLPSSAEMKGGYTEYDFAPEGVRTYISYQEDTFLLDNGKLPLENAKGVILIPEEARLKNANNAIIGLQIRLLNKVNCIEKLQELGIRGFFFVRQKRMPTTLCEAYVIGVDRNSHTPVIPFNGEYITEGFLNVDDTEDTKRYLSNEYSLHIIKVKNINTAAICPDYDINSPYLNTLFNGDTFVIKKNSLLTSDNGLTRLDYEDRYYYVNTFEEETEESLKAKVLGVEDNVKLTAIDDVFYSARAGEAEEAFRFEYANSDNLITEATNLLRGSFGPFLGIKNTSYKNKLITIKIPGYNSNNLLEYFQIRYTNQNSYYAISDRYKIDTIGDGITCYRGDCYICQVTHRVNRNFQDPSAPTNDIIVDKKCWEEHYEVSDGVMKTENFDNINLGDVNAVQLGLWITITVRSSMNLNIRALDDSIPDEVSLVGHPRTFYPNGPLSVAGVYKVPEALCCNKGFEKSVSERLNFEVPDVPAIKTDYTNRISYSDIHVNDAFKNGFRVFLGTSYRDYPKTYGQITKIIELRGTLICVFEHGVALIPVNERAVAAEGTGGNIYINTSNVLPENPKILSDTFGSLWKDSIIKTPAGIYGVDTVGKKIWRTNGTDFEIISNFKIQEFLNKNISLTERELTPTIGIRNVKTHYNKFKNDVMFTFYDNLVGFEEKVWNICYNELLGKWITFYSWVPSFSENIYNQYFSFNRDTSKWIAKLGVSHTNNSFADGVTLDNNIIDTSGNIAVDGSTGLYVTPIKVGTLSLIGRTLPSGKDIEYSINYILERDNLQNYTYFKIDDNMLYLTKPLSDTNIVWLLNVKANITLTCTSEDISAKEYLSTFEQNIKINGTLYKSVIAVLKDTDLDKLTTDFWKSGQAGIIDDLGKILPTFWYGKLHPFEFEIIVADEPSTHKIFDNLEIIGNSSEPESFHYEIVGDCFDFAKHKLNMYVRQEATKHLYQYNGSNITCDTDYIKSDDSEGIETTLYVSLQNPNVFEKSTILPLYYSRLDSINEIEDYYHAKDGSPTKDFSALAGGEIVKNNQEYHIWNHAKAVNLLNGGRLRGNMHYKEDKWYVLINPLNIVLRNEPKWGTEDIINRTNLDNTIPIELTLSPIPDDVLSNNIDIPEDDNTRPITVWPNKLNKEVKMKDKWIKIRVRYSGNKLTTINALRTLYSISYS